MMAQMFCSGVAGGRAICQLPVFIKGDWLPQGNSPLFAHAPAYGLPPPLQ